MRALSALLAFIVPAVASASEPEPEEFFEPEPGLQDYVAVTTKISEPIQLTPASVAVVTSEQIARAGYRSVGEALSAVSGLFVSYDLQNFHVAMRGVFGGARAGSRYLKIMIDGVPVSFVQSGTYFLGTEFIPISAVDRIEVLRGPASALYGAGAFSGAINVVTKRPPYEGEITTEGDLRLYGGTAGQTAAAIDTSLSVTAKSVFALAAIGGGYEDRSGLSLPEESPFALDYLDTNGDPRVSEGDLARPASVLAKLESHAAGGRFGGMFSASYNDRMAEFHDLTALSHNTRVNLYRWTASGYFERPFASGMTLTLQGNYSSGGPRQGDRLDLSSANSFILQRAFSYSETSGSAQVRYEIEGGGFALVGVDGMWDSEQLPQYSEVDRTTRNSTKRPAAPSPSISNYAGYAQVLYPIDTWLQIAAGLRYDYHSVYSGAFAARLAAVMPLSQQLSVKVLAARSYMAPSPEQLYGVPAGALDIEGTEELQPQYLHGGEVVVDYFAARWLNVATSVFYNRFTDALAYLTRGDRLVPTQFDANSYGGEILARASTEIGSGMRMEPTFGVALQNTVTQETDVGGVIEKDVPDNEAFPNTIIKGQLNFHLEPMYTNLFVSYRWIGERTPSQSNLRRNGNTDMVEPTYMLGAYQLLDLTLSTLPFEIGEGYGISGALRVSNLFDAQYSEIGFNGVDVPSLGRTLWLQVRMTM